MCWKVAGGTTGITTMDTTSEAHTLTLQGGVVTLSFNGPTTTTITDRSQDVPLLNFSINAARAIELRKHQIILCIDQGGNGTFDAAVNNFSDLEDIKIKNTDNGQVLVGPADGSSFTVQDNACPGGVAGLRHEFTDTFEVQAGQTLHLAITADIKLSNSSDASTALDSGDVIKAILKGYGTLAGSQGDLTVARYSGTNTAVTSSDFSPSTDMSGNNMTIGTSALNLGLAGSPQSITYVKGATNVDVAGFTFRTDIGSSVRINDVTLTGYISDNGTTFAKSKSLPAPDDAMSVQNLVSQVRLYDGDTGQLISQTPSANNLNTTTSTIVFNNLNWQIPAGATKRLLVKADLSSNAPSGSSDAFSFDIASNTDVTGIDQFGTSVNATGAPVNGATSPIVKVTVTSGGTITASLSPATPVQEGKYWGQTATEFSRFRLTANSDNFLLERLILTTNDNVTDLVNNVKNVSIRYATEDGRQVTQVGTFSATGSASFAFTGADRPFIPKDSSADIIVVVDMKTKSEGATSQKTFSIDLANSFNGSTNDGFRAVGEGSGTVVTGSSINDVAGNNMAVWRVFPRFDQVSIASGEPLGTKDVMRFTITAMGLPDSSLLFDGPSNGLIKFDVVASGGANSNLTATTYGVDDGLVYSTDTITNAQRPSPHASLSVDFNQRDLEIAGGTSKTLRIEVGFQNFNDRSDYFQLRLLDNQDGLIQWIDDPGHLATSIAGYLRQLPMSGPIFSKL